MESLECPFLGVQVELTGERIEHIEFFHGDLLPKHIEELIATVFEPDFVGSRPGRSEIAFCRQWSDIQGRSVVVVVAQGSHNVTGVMRYWVVTAYIARSTRTWNPL